MMRFAGQNKMDSYVSRQLIRTTVTVEAPYPAAQLKELGALVRTGERQPRDFTLAVSPG